MITVMVRGQVWVPPPASSTREFALHLVRLGDEASEALLWDDACYWYALVWSHGPTLGDQTRAVFEGFCYRAQLPNQEPAARARRHRAACVVMLRDEAQHEEEHVTQPR